MREDTHARLLRNLREARAREQALSQAENDNG
jgi:heme exporter protein D